MFRRLISVASRVGKDAARQSLLPSLGCGATRRFAAQAAAAASRGSGVSWGSVGAMAFAGTAGAFAFALPAEASSNKERSFIMIKPDGVHRGLIADIIKRFEQKGFKLVAIKVVVPAKATAESHYEEHAARPFFPKLVNFLSSGAVVAMVWEGKDVIKYGRTMIGATNPLASAPGTIRGDFGIDVGRNIIHGSDSLPSAQREIALWFKPEEIAEYDVVAKSWIYE